MIGLPLLLSLHAAYVQELKAKHPEIMQELLMDVLRVLSTPDMDIRRKTLNIALDLTTAQNIEEVFVFTSSLSKLLPAAYTISYLQLVINVRHNGDCRTV